MCQDTEGRDIELRYFRDVDRREVDFVIVEDGNPLHFVECKKKSGRDINRPQLLENLLPFRVGYTGITPPVSFGVCVKIRKKIAKENQYSFLDDINL